MRKSMLLRLLVIAGVLLQGRCFVRLHSSSTNVLAARGRPGFLSVGRAARQHFPIATAAAGDSSAVGDGMPEKKKVAGRPHTPESRARISAANKGNVPWNK